MSELNLKFRKKPVVIEAFQFQQSTSVDEAPEWLTEAVLKNDFLVVDGVAHITTLEGIMTAQPGDWIIRGVKGEIYPCKPDIFSATYEPAAPVSTPQQSAQRASVEEDEQFEELVGDVYRAGSYNDSIEKPLRALISHINTWGTAGSTAGAEAVSVLLWLYRRLPRTYGRPPHVEAPIIALAKAAGVDLKDVTESFAERGAAPSNQSPAEEV